MLLLMPKRGALPHVETPPKGRQPPTCLGPTGAHQAGPPETQWVKSPWGNRKGAAPRGGDLGRGLRPQPACLSSSPSYAADPVVDVLTVLQLQKEPEGVRKTPGFCPQRRSGSGMDAAFRISRRAQISAPTRQLFPGIPPPQGCRWDGGP